MASIARCLAWFSLLFVLAACTTPMLSRNVLLTDQWCAQHFHGPCPTARYVPPQLIAPPTGPVPDLNLRAMSCDVIFGTNVVTAHVRNDGDANAQALSSSGDPVIVTVTATLRSGGIELAQGSGGGPGFLAAGNEANAIHVQVNHDWTQYSHVSVGVESVFFNAERNYSNNDLEADVATAPLADSTAFDTVYCEMHR